MKLISNAKSLMLSKRGLGIIGLALTIFWVWGVPFFRFSDGVYHYKYLGFLNSMILIWLSVSVAYKIILILDLKKINLSLVGFLASVLFVIFFVSVCILVKREVPSKTMGWYCDTVLVFSLFGSVWIDMFTPFSDIDEYRQCVKNFCGFCYSKIFKRRNYFN